MVHVGLLPNHDRWGDVLSNLRYVIVDEAHVYRGVFGSHVANVLRRLRRLARIYGAEPQFLLASATISNPGELGASLLGEPVTVIGDDAAPRTERTIVLWNPPLLDAELGLRASALAEAARLQAMFVDRGLRTLTFAKSRKAAELIHRFTAERLGDDTHLSPYRAGYTRGRAAGDRAAALGRRAARRLRDERARARDRHRTARRGHLRRLPRHGRVAAPAVGTRRAARQRARGARRDRGRARPVLHARAGQAARPAGRGGDPRSREPARARRPRARGRLRGAADRERRGDARARGARAQHAPTRSSRRRPPGIVWAGKDHPAARDPAALDRPRRVHRRRRDDRLRARPRRAQPRVHDRARGRRLPPPRRVVPRARARPDDAARGRRAVRRRLVHAGEAGDDDPDRRAAPGRVAARARAGVRRDRGDRAGRRLRAQDDLRRRSGSSSSRSTCRRRRSRPRRSGSCRRRSSSPGSTRCRSCSARCTPPSTR